MANEPGNARPKRPSPKWSRGQTNAAYCSFGISIAMFTVEGIGWEPFGRPVDFGILPLALLLVSGWVLFQLNITRLLRGLDPEGREEGE